MVENKKIMPVLVLILATGMHGIDIFTEYEISLEQIIAFDAFLAPFGLGGLLRASHKTYVASKTNAGNIPPEDMLKLQEILAKIKK